MQIIPKTSPNFNDRSDDSVLDMIILHYTDTISLQNSIDVMLENGVSAHYLIDLNGDIYQLIDEEKRAWHAGLSYWNGVTDINSHSIGIEIQNNGHGHGYHDFPAEQIKSVSNLCADIVKRRKIPIYNILAHSDIAPSRKQDPGELFPWQGLAKQGLSIFPELAKDIDDGDLRELLTEYGYNPDDDLEDIIIAFNRHYCPEQFDAGIHDNHDQIRQYLKSLIKQRLALQVISA